MTHLAAHVTTPQLAPGATSSWAQYCITLAAGSDREAIRSQLMKKASRQRFIIQSMHEQARISTSLSPMAGRITADACERVLALPFHPYLEAAQQDQVIARHRGRQRLIAFGRIYRPILLAWGV